MYRIYSIAGSIVIYKTTVCAAQNVLSITHPYSEVFECSKGKTQTPTVFY